MHVKKQHSLVLSAVLQMILYKHYTYGSWVTQSTDSQGFHWQKQMFCVTRKGLRTWHGQGSMKRSGKYMLVPAKKKNCLFQTSLCFEGSNVVSTKQIAADSVHFNCRWLKSPTARNITNLKTLEGLLSSSRLGHTLAAVSAFNYLSIMIWIWRS